MDEIKADIRQVRLSTAPGAGVQYPNPPDWNRVSALTPELEELDKVVNTLSQVRSTLADKARNLYTNAQVCDAQASAAELIAAPLRREIEAKDRELRTYRDRVAEVVQKLDGAQALARLRAGWLDLKEGELASANAQRDQARARVEELERSVAHARMLVERKDLKITELIQERTARDRLLFARSAKLAEIKNLVTSDPISVAMNDCNDSTRGAGRHAVLLADVMAQIRSILAE